VNRLPSQLQKSLPLGPFKIEHPFLLAPMAGITNSPFRRLMRSLGSALVISELVSANGLEFGGRRTKQLLSFHEDERTVGLQIFGERPELLVKACQYVEKLGADFVDLNLGCPVPKIVKKGAGCAMCKDPVSLGKTLKAMVGAVKIPVTIKIRTGWDALSINAHEIIQVAADSGVAWVAVHGRTRAQGYSGEADWELIGNLKAKSSLPIIGNGDIRTPEEAVEKWKKFGVDAVLIGRAALRNPFIFKQAFHLWRQEEYKAPTIEDVLSMMRSFRKLLDESFDERLALLHAKKVISWFAAGYPYCHGFRKNLFSMSDRDSLWREAIHYFEENAQRRNMDFLEEPFLMGGHG